MSSLQGKKDLVHKSLVTKAFDKTTVISSKFFQVSIFPERNINFIVRPSELCQDNSGDYDFLKHTIQELDLIAKNKKSIINLRPTSPLRLKSDLVRFSKKSGGDCNC